MSTTTLAQRFMGGLTLSQAADLFSNRPHVATMHRWCLKGTRGVKLRSWLVGGVRCTDAKAVEEFLLALNRDNSEVVDDSDQRSSEAGAALEKLGC
ncbi:MAG: DUF1580 domain-containing protein [Planctomycetaceae bacterium]